MQSKPEKLAPHASDAEEAVLGSILINPDTLIDVASQLTTDMFFVVKNAWVYDTYLKLQATGQAIDYLTVVEDLRTTTESGKSRLELMGGAAYLTSLANNTPTHIHAVTYAGIVRRLWRRRNLLDAATKIAQLAMRDNLSEPDLVNATDKEYYAAVEAAAPNETISMSSVMSEIYDEVLYRLQHPDEAMDIATGYPSLDNKLGGGMQAGDLVIVAARPGMGKTSLALGIALKQTERHNKTCGVFTLEMSPKQLGYRAAALEAGINSKKFRTGRLDEFEVSEFTRAVMKLGQLPIHFDGQQNANINDVCAKARKMHREHGIDVLFVDYLQLMLQGDVKFATQETGQITRKFKLLARELGIAVVLLSQLNREVEKRKDKRPMLADLRQSGAIEQDADTVMFIYRDEMYDENSPKAGLAEIIIAKQRNGETGTVDLGYQSYTTKFFEAEITKVYLND